MGFPLLYWPGLMDLLPPKASTTTFKKIPPRPHDLLHPYLSLSQRAVSVFVVSGPFPSTTKPPSFVSSILSQEPWVETAFKVPMKAW